ncbi:hypothetical protein FCR2A7T_18940 [Flavobacterium cauense R2A-7]|uniref:Uncharacterized protein DUF4252 n=1 Tax=Flavobacterium cauense R2A-7 TaxID=1341154 RepID=V6RZ36_9FLAO|nr:DUF4252 domain-containing protein [Flavobacterium cauense]ESU19731.1 hypothetical protein FCR2A7T_18940 [Flavobacterium cauense R2A-7]KGO79828.1 hypothetical protein Q762_13710 [Flavobacterium cauense R2A-7]TWI09207.1 uncharacterized protein DUF4252 [Flavobacterium cauense R2A-7]
MKRYLFIGLVSVLFFASCEQKPSLQKYFVENTENKEFIAVDIAPSIINVDKVTLSGEEKAALASFKKINVLAFKADSTNQKEFDAERSKVTTILKDKSYQELMKVGSGKEGGAIYFVGEDEHIDEFVLFANKKENGFAVVRILGEDMNPTHVMNLMSLLKKANVDMEQLKPLQALMQP